MMWRSKRSCRLFVASVVVILGCSSTEQPAPPERAEPLEVDDAVFLAAARVALPPPDQSGDLPEPESDGARLVEQYCAGCHAVPTPGIHSAADWPIVARRMWLRIDGVGARVALPRPTAAERTEILRYLTRHALRTSGSVLPEGPGRNTFVVACGRCHELPDLHVHTVDDWGGVVSRMSERMESMLGEGLEAEDQSAILEYIAAVWRTTEP